jgi:Zn ribbon nucleic-acid-binding protein
MRFAVECPACLEENYIRLEGDVDNNYIIECIKCGEKYPLSLWFGHEIDLEFSEY